MADRQTAGGYPKIASVIAADLPIAGQLAPGDFIEFAWCSRQEAAAALIARERPLLRVADRTAAHERRAGRRARATGARWASAGRRAGSGTRDDEATSATALAWARARGVAGPRPRRRQQRRDSPTRGSTGSSCTSTSAASTVDDRRRSRCIVRAGAGEPWDPFVAATVARRLRRPRVPVRHSRAGRRHAGAERRRVRPGCVRRRSRAWSVVDRDARIASSMLAKQSAASAIAPAASSATMRPLHRDARGVRAVAGGAADADLCGCRDVLRRSAAKPTPSLATVRDAILAIRRRKGMVIEAGNPANRSVGSFFVNPVVAREHFERLAAVASDARAALSQSATDRGEDAGGVADRARRLSEGHDARPVGISPFQAQAIVNHGGAPRARRRSSWPCDVKRAVWRRSASRSCPEPVFVGFPPSPELQWLLTRTAVS